MLGYEVVGEVTEVGDGVDKKWIGKRVIALTRFGGYAEFVTTFANGVAEIGDMDAGVATALATQYATAWYMVCILEDTLENIGSLSSRWSRHSIYSTAKNLNPILKSG